MFNIKYYLFLIYFIIYISYILCLRAYETPQFLIDELNNGKKFNLKNTEKYHIILYLPSLNEEFDEYELPPVDIFKDIYQVFTNITDIYNNFNNNHYINNKIEYKNQKLFEIWKKKHQNIHFHILPIQDLKWKIEIFLPYEFQDITCLIQPPLPNIITKRKPDYIINNHQKLTPKLLLKQLNKYLDTYININSHFNKIGNYLLNTNLYHVINNEKCEKISINNIDKNIFFNDYILKQKPVIITDITYNNDLLNLISLNINDLNNLYGNEKVHVKISPNGIFEGPELLSDWDYNNIDIPENIKNKFVVNDYIIARAASLDINLNEFFNLVNNIHLYNNNTNDKPSFYIEYLDLSSYLYNLLNKNSTKYEFLSFFQNLDNNQKNEIRNLWIGMGRTNGKLHFDPYDNIMMPLQGTKRFIITDPLYSKDLYEGHILEGLYNFDLKTGLFSRNEILEATSIVNSPIDLENIDLNRFPNAINIPFLDCLVKKNEFLYLPSYYWHEVISTPDQENKNIAINLWWNPLYKKKFPCANCNKYINSFYNEQLEKYLN